MIACVTGACAGTFGEAPDHRSWSQRETDAQHHDDLADVHAEAAQEITLGEERYSCGDTVLGDQSTTGGQPITYWQPCFDVQEEGRAVQHAAERRERALARHDRHTAALLARAEALSCRMVPPAERTHSPFAHTKEIDEVIPHRVGGTLAGVRIVFRPVPGLDADWMRRAIACRQAQWLVFGKDPQLDPDDPTLIDSADVTVTQHDGHVEVLITSDSPQDAEVALTRANRQAALAAK